MNTEDLQKLYTAVLEGNAKLAKETTEKALAAGIDPMKLVQDFMVPAMREVGQRFECNEYFVPELLLSARAMKTVLELIRPLLANSGVQPAARVVIGTVQGDLHDIGKNLVGAMLEGGGFEVIDLGVNVDPYKFAETAREKNATVIAMSALLTTTMPAMKTTIDALTKVGVRQQVKVLVGGAPITQKFADEIGADGYSESAAGAVALVNRVMGA
jgi:corrinoid protein of di/trimethylamine methyltransferase